MLGYFKNWVRGAEQGDEQGVEELDRLIAEVRSDVARPGADSRLSAVARSRILTEVSRSAGQAPLWPGLFAPSRRLWVAGGLPLLLAAGLILVLERAAVHGPGPGQSGTPAVVFAAKVGDQLEFTIANGRRSHFIYRATAPDGFTRGGGIPVTDGSYVENLDDESSIVYYRIE